MLYLYGISPAAKINEQACPPAWIFQSPSEVRCVSEGPAPTCCSGVNEWSLGLWVGGFDGDGCLSGFSLSVSR